MSSHSNQPDAGNGPDRPNRPTQTAPTDACDPENAPRPGGETDRSDAALTAVETASGRGVRVAALRAETDLLRAERESLKSQVDTLEAEVSSLEADVAALERALADSRQETERVRQRYERVIEQKDRACQRLEAAADGGDGPLAAVRSSLGAAAARLRRIGRD